jgi:hypothetical protein
MMHVQMVMDGLQKPDKPEWYHTFSQMFEDDKCQIEKKLGVAGWIYKF